MSHITQNILQVLQHHSNIRQRAKIFNSTLSRKSVGVGKVYHLDYMVKPKDFLNRYVSLQLLISCSNLLWEGLNIQYYLHVNGYLFGYKSTKCHWTKLDAWVPSRGENVYYKKSQLGISKKSNIRYSNSDISLEILSLNNE